ncbi:MAG: 4Fe-4S cluster-binding domain-containing protein [Acholeplasmataceae bacterium]
MIKYYKKLILSLSEIQGHPSLLIHGLTGCMFHCYECFNYDELVVKKHDEYYLIDDVIEYIVRQKDLFEYILFSGGEFMLASLEDLEEDLSKIKAISDKKIIVYTTGVELHKMKVLTEKKLIDGFHIDMKLPYHLLTLDDLDLIELTMGIKIKDLTLIEKLIESLHFVVKNDQGISQIRSVKYPFLDESAFIECKSFIMSLNDLYNKNIPYEAHTFIYAQEDKKED